MALINCIDCGKAVSDKAKICPNCGCPIECSLEAIQQPAEQDAVQEQPDADMLLHEETAPVAAPESTPVPDNQPSLPAESKIPPYQPPQNSPEKKENGTRGIKIAVLVISLAVIGTLIAGLMFFANNNKSTTSSSTKTTAPATTTAHINTTDVIEYIAGRAVYYDKETKEQQVFFGFQDANKNYITTSGGTATIKITNTADEVVFEKKLSFSSSDFGSWSHEDWETDRTLVCLYIKPSEITTGKTDRGILTLSVVTEDSSFKAYDMQIYNLPCKYENTTNAANTTNSTGVTVHKYHTYVSSVTKEATCLEGGILTFTCGGCGDSYTEPSPKSSYHNFVSATCTEPKKCKWCGLTEGEPKGHSFDTNGKCYSCKADDPAKLEALSKCSLSLPVLPRVVTDRRSNGDMISSVYVTDISYEFDYSSSGGIILTVRFSGTKTFDERGDGQSDAAKIGWKLYDSKGNVYETGTFYSPHLANGESFAEQEATLLYGYKGHKPDAYRLELLDVN